MTKVVYLSLLLGSFVVAGCHRSEDSSAASPSPVPVKPVAISVDAATAEPAPAEAVPTPAAATPETPDAPAAPVKLPPFINADAPPTASAAEGSRRPAAVNSANALAALNKALKAYLSTHQQELPGSLDDLTAAGLLAAMPDAPSGMAYVIDPNRREVVLKKQ